jgi:hypothetical protein
MRHRKTQTTALLECTCNIKHENDFLDDIDIDVYDSQDEEDEEAMIKAMLLAQARNYNYLKSTRIAKIVFSA